MIRKVLCVAMLAMLPLGCADFFYGKERAAEPVAVAHVAAVPALPPGYAYALTITFNDDTAPAADTLDGEPKSGLPSNTVAGGVSIVAILRGLPLVGAFIFGADAAKEIAKNANKGPVTDVGVTEEAVMKQSILSGRVKSIMRVPVYVGPPVAPK